MQNMFNIFVCCSHRHQSSSAAMVFLALKLEDEENKYWWVCKVSLLKILKREKRSKKFQALSKLMQKYIPV